MNLYNIHLLPPSILIPVADGVRRGEAPSRRLGCSAREVEGESGFLLPERYEWMDEDCMGAVMAVVVYLRMSFFSLFLFVGRRKIVDEKRGPYVFRERRDGKHCIIANGKGWEITERRREV
ncbi:hypothetical protein ACMFMG_010719 [Clarireedia jacksonii]